jgi:microcystin-dependent protein
VIEDVDEEVTSLNFIQTVSEDFHTLSRKELQALSKMNKIPANITNAAMADALSALPHVNLSPFLDLIFFVSIWNRWCC